MTAAELLALSNTLHYHTQLARGAGHHELADKLRDAGHLAWAAIRKLARDAERTAADGTVQS